MPKLTKAQKASRLNGSMASNKGKIVADKVKVIICKSRWNRGALEYTFESVLRAKLHKKELYADEARALNVVKEAEQTVQLFEKDPLGAADSAGQSLEEARSTLAAFRAAQDEAA